MGESQGGKKRRIAGAAFWKLKGFLDRIEEKQKELQRWREQTSESLELYPEQVNWSLGTIYDPLCTIEDGKVVNAKIIGRVPRDLWVTHQSKIAELQAIDKELGDFRNMLAKRLRIWPDAINPRDGTITADQYDIIELDEQGGCVDSND